MIAVTAGILIKEDKVMIALRKAGKHLAGYWEFPGGKIDEGESAEACLVREFEEEFGVKVSIIQEFVANTHHYTNKSVHIQSFIIQHEQGDFQLLDHDAIEWVTADKLFTYQLAPADIPITKKLVDWMKE